MPLRRRTKRSLMLPVSKIDGTWLNYPYRTNDFSQLFKRAFVHQPSGVFRLIPFWRSRCENDAVLFDDGYDPEERAAVFKAIGEKMQPDRWNTCREIYMNAGINATIITYDSLGHKHPPEVMENILSFFISAIEEGDSTATENNY